LAENEDVAILFSLIKLSIRELCTTYVPVATTKKITTIDKKFPVAQLKNFLRN